MQCNNIKKKLQKESITFQYVALKLHRNRFNQSQVEDDPSLSTAGWSIAGVMFTP